MNISKVKYLYQQYTQILQIVTDADRHDEYAENLRLVLTVENIITMKAFTRWCKDVGIPQLIRKVN